MSVSSWRARSIADELLLAFGSPPPAVVKTALVGRFTWVVTLPPVARTVSISGMPDCSRRREWSWR